jgi:hydrogenase maturation protein HypF
VAGQDADRPAMMGTGWASPMMETGTEVRQERTERLQIQVRGTVQGVGFRPFVYKMARNMGLVGHVFNSSAAVVIEIEGSAAALDEFVEALRTDAPQLAEVQQINVERVAPLGTADFSIVRSREVEGMVARIPADAGTCDACWRDFDDPKNRRFGYPFTNCTHCGPRYTITHKVPYDRPNTTMAAFTMCSVCMAEYVDPSDRRFHAQPTACAVCGPGLALVERGGRVPQTFSDVNALPILRRARSVLREGKILAVKGLGGFLLACDATNEAAVATLRQRKHRPHKPFALMVRDVDAARRLCAISAEEEAALHHLRRPIVLLERTADAKLAPGIADGHSTVGVMLPYTPLHYLLFSDSVGEEPAFSALVMTSGNLSEEPIVIDNAEAMERLDGVADWFLMHNREIATRVDDSVARCFAGQQRVLRRSRGFAPQTIVLEMAQRQVLAFGGELKNTFCLTKDGEAMLSQHIGDLQNYETMQFFEQTLDKMKRLFHVSPEAVAHDLHPDYMSTHMALACGIERRIGIQHHHAHIASCMAENALQGQVIGVAFDGTGYGTDGRIWGGEFLICDYAGFRRAAHLRNVLLAGGDAAVRQPWRSALSYVRDALGEQGRDELRCFSGVPEQHVVLVERMLARRINTVESSSCGRLFDAVAALLGLASEVTFEGQAAIALEAVASPGDERYDFGIEDGESSIVDFRPMVAAVVDDLARGEEVGVISGRFHNTLSAAIVRVCERIRESDGLDRVCLSGGTFQNVLLLHRTVQDLRLRGFGVFLHSVVPPNDGGIALGQAAIANAVLQRGD